jgi:hypothetical protein
MKTIRDDKVFAGVPSSPVNDQENPFVWAGPDLFRKSGYGLVKPIAVHPRQNEPLGIARRGMDKSLEVRPLVAWLNEGQGALTDFGPDFTNHRL